MIDRFVAAAARLPNDAAINFRPCGANCRPTFRSRWLKFTMHPFAEFRGPASWFNDRQYFALPDFVAILIRLTQDNRSSSLADISATGAKFLSNYKHPAQ